MIGSFGGEGSNFFVVTAEVVGYSHLMRKCMKMKKGRRSRKNESFSLYRRPRKLPIFFLCT